MAVEAGRERGKERQKISANQPVGPGTTKATLGRRGTDGLFQKLTLKLICPHNLVCRPENNSERWHVACE